MTAQARAIVVNSRAAATDIARYVPGATAQVFALPFAPAPSPDWEDDFPETVARYGATSPFFLISNQFWIHKDHATAFAAFRIVAARHSEVRLVCTGQTGDARDPEYFPRLLADLKTWKLEDRVRILGLIPKRDQIELMKNAAAVIQPTRFEGGPGGGSVYDAVSLGVPAIVSDIPVNREIDCGSVEFFPVGDAAALAAQMETRLAASAPRPEWSVLVADGQRRRAACGMVLWQSIEFTLEAGKRVDWR
jgi:glycosyltransferase involved in cell wall biosynthesis